MNVAHNSKYEQWAYFFLHQDMNWKHNIFTVNAHKI